MKLHLRYPHSYDLGDTILPANSIGSINALFAARTPTLIHQDRRSHNGYHFSSRLMIADGNHEATIATWKYINTKSFNMETTLLVALTKMAYNSRHASPGTHRVNCRRCKIYHIPCCCNRLADGIHHDNALFMHCMR